MVRSVAGNPHMSLPSLSLRLFVLGFLWLANANLQAQVTSGPDWRWLPGDTAPAAGWQAVGFDDAGWLTARQPLHGDTRAEGTPIAGPGTVHHQVFLRQTFRATQAEKLGSLQLGAVAADGFVVWLNGVEIIRQNVPDGPLDPAANAVAPVARPLGEEAFSVDDPSRRLVNGDNVLAVQLLTAAAGSGADLFWHAGLAGTIDLTPPTIIAQVPPVGTTVESLSFTEVIFNEPASGVDAADLRVNGQPATNVVQIAPGHYRFDFPPADAGAVVISFEAGHGIDDGLAAPNPLVPVAWSLQVDPAAVRHNAILSEVVTDNYRSLADEDREYPDWIELANLGDTPLDLRGWALTDDPGDRFKWRFGTATLPANGYLVVYASQKNKTNVTAKTRLHTNFKLSADGEYLALVAPDGEVVSEFSPAIPPLRTDVSFGRLADAPDRTGLFATPTPNARNSSSGEGFAPEVAFSVPSGTYPYEFRLRLSTPDPRAVIRYSLNGSVPTETSPSYDGPITVNTSVEVRARAFAPDRLPGPVHSEGYVRLSTDPAQQAGFTSSLPILVMSTLRTATISQTRNTPVQFSLHEPVDGQSSLLRKPTFTSRGGAKVRGSSSSSLPKTPYAIEFWDEFNEDKKAGLLGLPADSEWVLYAPNQFEPVMVHNPFVHQLSRELGQYSPRTRFVELYVQRNSGTLLTNQWMGIYVLEEKPAIGANRLAIDKLKSEDVGEPEITGGYLLKFDRLDPSDSGISYGTGTVAAVDPKEPELETSQRAPQLAYIRKHLGDFTRSQATATWRDPVTGYLPYIDLTNWVDYHIVEVLSGNVDSLVLSAYFHKERGGPIKWGPHWDFDRALGSTDGRDSNPKNWLTGPFFGSVWWSRILRDPTAWQLWVDRYQEFRDGAMSRTNMNRIIDEFTAQVTPSQPREQKRWTFMRPRGGSYLAEINLMKNWLSNRVTYIDGQMTARPTLSAAGGRVQPGFTVSISRQAGSTVFYTLDGSDPRLPFGTNEVAPQARTYSGPITITQGVRLVARARNLAKRQTGGPLTSTPWSGPVAATFTVSEPPLAVTEIMFHPARPASGGGPDEDEFEFIELRNVSPEPVSLPGYRLHGGIDFAFTADSGITALAPGERLLLVANRAAFESRYPGVFPIAGEFAGRLGNAGARLALTGPLLEPVFDFTFSDRWQRLADGSGFSLVRDGDGSESNDPDTSVAWRLSGRFGGSPGQPDPAPEFAAHRAASVRFSEVYATGGKQNFVELEAPAGTLTGPLDLTGWWLSNERDEWAKFRLPAGSVLNPAGPDGARLVLRESLFNLPDGEGFSLDAKGGEVWLFSADTAGELTGFVTGGRYGAAAGGQSVVHDGLPGTEQSFVAAGAPTPGSAGLPPSAGPVVIRSVHFQPADIGGENNARDEFIELANHSEVPMPLFAPGLPEVSWHLRGGVEMELPAGLTLPPGGRLVLVGFDPGSDRTALGAFLAGHRPAPGTPLAGPWRGQLNNAGESLRLLRPFTDTDGTTYVEVDRLAYSPTAPWPVDTAGTGLALVRRNPAALGVAPENWTAAWPTPGWNDMDGDGLPDPWESAHGLDPRSPDGEQGPDGDPDGDGFANRMEFVNGTDPRNSDDALRPAVLEGARGQLVLQLAAPAGKTILLQRTADLSSTTWQTVRSVTVRGGDAGPLTFEETDTEGRYYRLVTE